MKRYRTILILFISFFLANCGYQDDFFRVGQIWHYKTRPSEPNSTLTIVSVDNDEELGVIVGVYIDKLNIRGLGEGSVINFLPLSKDALKNDLEGIKGHTDDLPDYKDSYKEWRNKFDSKQCKIITYTIAQVIDSFQIKLEKK